LTNVILERCDGMNRYEVLAGSIIAAHGVQGALKLRLATKTALALVSTGEGVSRRPVDVWIGADPKSDDNTADGRMAVVTQVKQLREGGAVYLIKIQGIRDRNAAEELVGRSVFAPESRRAPLQDGEYFADELIGCTVTSDTGRDYGKIKSVLAQPANDVYETDRGALIPAVKAVVLSVDLDERRITVADIAGLYPQEAEEVAPGDGPHRAAMARDDASESAMDQVVG
jgi:16S rRNA processing protein RimM